MAIPETAARSKSTARRFASILLTLGALGETGVGALAFAYPQIIAVLMAAPLDSAGRTVARMLGAAALALGVTWWIARSAPSQLARNAAGFLVYNIGVGVAFGIAALNASEPVLPWIVSIVHLALAAAFGGALAATPRNEADRGVKS